MQNTTKQKFLGKMNTREKYDANNSFLFTLMLFTRAYY